MDKCRKKKTLPSSEWLLFLTHEKSENEYSKMNTHPRGFTRRLAGEPTISPSVQKTCPRKSCHGGSIKWNGERRRCGAKDGDVRWITGVTRRVGEDLSIVISIVRL